MRYYGLEWDSLTSYFQFKEIDEPATPQANELRVYAKDKAGTSALYLKDDAGDEREIGQANIVTGTGAANRLAYWVDSTTIGAIAAITAGRVLFADSNGLPTHDSDLTFATDTLTSTKLRSTNIGVGQAPTSLPLDVLAQAADFVSGLRIRASTGTNRWLDITHAFGGAFFTSADNAALDSEQVIGFRQESVGGATSREVGRFGPLGGLNVGSSGASVALGVISAVVGYRIGNAAASGAILLGNGTNFVSSAQSGLDHGSIGGLSDDDHSIYALLAGRSGGQTLKGGTDSGDDLTLVSTNHATKGSIIFGTSAYDEVNNRLGIGTAAPGTDVEIYKSGAVPILNVVGEWDQASMNVQLRGTSHSGANVNAGVVFRGFSTRGSKATPTATAADDILAQFIGDGYTTDFTVNGQAAIRMRASALWASGSAPTYIVFDTTPSGSATPLERIRIAADGKVGIGASNPFQMLHIRATEVDAGILSDYFGDGPNAAFFAMRNNRGTVGSPTATQSGDVLGNLLWQGRYGTTVDDADIANGGVIQGLATENWASGSTGTKLNIHTAPNGGVSRVVCTFDQDGSFALPVDPAWTSYSPSLAAGSGTFTDASVTGSYRRIGRTIHVRATVTITTSGTANGDIRVGLPDGAVGGQGCGRENAVNGKMVSVTPSGSLVLINNYDNSSPIVDGASIGIFITYEADGAS